MNQLYIHKDAEKAFQKAPKRIQKKIYACLGYLIEKGTKELIFPVKHLQGDFKKFEYMEIKIDRDYRIIFRKKKELIFIRDAGTHNSLRTS